MDLFQAQPKVWDRLSQIKSSNQIGSAYLFSGPSGSGKEGLAIKFAQYLNCESHGEMPCNSCPSCLRFQQLQHEKLTLIFPLPTPKKSSSDNEDPTTINKQDLDIVTEAIAEKAQDPFFKIQIPKANRILIQSVRELRKSLYLKSEDSGRKTVLIFDAHLLSAGQGEAANALLKILEEPPQNTTLILVTDYIELLLPTILSRCQKIGVPNLPDSSVHEWLTEKMVKESDISFIVGLSQGNIHQARHLKSQSVADILKLLGGLIKMLTQENPDHWRKFCQTYGRFASQDLVTFSFHFKLLKLWFRSVSRLQNKVPDLLHNTSLKPTMDRLIQTHPNANYSGITLALEDTILAIPQNLYMPLILTNLLIQIQKHLNP